MAGALCECCNPSIGRSLSEDRDLPLALAFAATRTTTGDRGQIPKEANRFLSRDLAVRPRRDLNQLPPPTSDRVPISNPPPTSARASARPRRTSRHRLTMVDRTMEAGISIPISPSTKVNNPTSIRARSTGQARGIGRSSIHQSGTSRSIRTTTTTMTTAVRIDESRLHAGSGHRPIDGRWPARRLGLSHVELNCRRRRDRRRGKPRGIS